MHIVKSVGIKLGTSTCKDPDIYDEYEARLSLSHTHIPSLDTTCSIISYSTQTFIDAIISNASTSAWTTFHESTHRIRLACKCNHKNDTFSARRLFRFSTILSQALSLEYQPTVHLLWPLCHANVTFEAGEIRHSSTTQRALSRSLL